MSIVEEVLKQNLEAGWSKEEFKNINCGDKRIDKRFHKVTEQLSETPTKSINQSCKWPIQKQRIDYLEMKK